MEQNNKYFKLMLNEISTIKEEDIRLFAICLLVKVPEYFFSVAASSSGKYHPMNDLGEGGLVRHSISVKKMLDHLMEPNGYYDFTERQKDLLRVAALFHDCFKSGTQEQYQENIHTKHLHPLYAHNFIITESIVNKFPYEDAKYIADAVISHMGQWNTSWREDGVLPLPKTPEQKILHLADYLSSRKDINMTIEAEEDTATTTNEGAACDEKKENV